MMLHTKYEPLGSVVSDKEIFSCFPYISLYKTCNQPERSHCGPQGQNLYKRGRGPLDDASFQIFML